jgi:hypothetical protein
VVQNGQGGLLGLAGRRWQKSKLTEQLSIIPVVFFAPKLGFAPYKRTGTTNRSSL